MEDLSERNNFEKKAADENNTWITTNGSKGKQ